MARGAPKVKRPSDIEIWLYESWPITTLSVSYRPRSEDEADTYVAIHGAAGRKEFKWETVRDLLDVEVGYKTVAQLKRYRRDQVAAWKEYEAKNKAELAEYERLKEKFG